MGRASARWGWPSVAPETASGAQDPAQMTFEAALAELERVVRQLESGELGLDAALGLYERGVALIRRCSAQLEAAEARLEVLTQGEDGTASLRPAEGLEP